MDNHQNINNHLHSSHRSHVFLYQNIMRGLRVSIANWFSDQGLVYSNECIYKEYKEPHTSAHVLLCPASGGFGF